MKLCFIIMLMGYPHDPVKVLGGIMYRLGTYCLPFIGNL